ncbi:chaperone NapD [Pasteurellaceae bacterium LIM206]|nr:chaperone NapD [Pasteurellaceae bacterium LIM206]
MNNNLKQSKNWYVCSLVVQAHPEKLESVKAELLRMPYTEVHAQKSAEGKLVVTMESDAQLELGDRIESVKNISGVIVVSLISNYIDEA